jgi:hypothetical protein
VLRWINNLNKFLLKRFNYDNFVFGILFLRIFFFKISLLINFFANKFFFFKRYYSVICYGYNVFCRGFFIWINNSKKNRIFLYIFFCVCQFFNFFKRIILSLFIIFFLVLFLLDFFKLVSYRYISVYVVVFFLFFWLFSGFNYFLKKYRFGKFTSAIQRFWKRAYVLFWIIEAALFFLFFYFYLNSSQESLYFYDESSLNKMFLGSAINSYISYCLIVLVLFILFFLLVNFSTLVFYQYLIMLIFCFFLLDYIFLLETYQFYYIITLISETRWVFNEELNLWEFVHESINLRNKKQYFLFILILKYWHFLFIFISFMFFLSKSFESRRISYSLLVFNIQNLLILLFLNMCLNIQFAKFFLLRFFTIPYYWFFVCYDFSSVYLCINEIYLFVSTVFTI